MLICKRGAHCRGASAPGGGLPPAERMPRDHTQNTARVSTLTLHNVPGHKHLSVKTSVLLDFYNPAKT